LSSSSEVEFKPVVNKKNERVKSAGARFAVMRDEDWIRMGKQPPTKKKLWPSVQPK
jgi:hypothetical protein